MVAVDIVQGAVIGSQSLAGVLDQVFECAPCGAFVCVVGWVADTSESSLLLVDLDGLGLVDSDPGREGTQPVSLGSSVTHLLGATGTRAFVLTETSAHETAIGEIDLATSLASAILTSGDTGFYIKDVVIVDPDELWYVLGGPGTFARFDPSVGSLDATPIDWSPANALPGPGGTVIDWAFGVDFSIIDPCDARVLATGSRPGWTGLQAFQVPLAD